MAAAEATAVQGNVSLSTLTSQHDRRADGFSCRQHPLLQPFPLPLARQERLCYEDRPIMVDVLTADEALHQRRGSLGREKLPHSPQKGLSQCLVVLLSFCISPPSGQEDMESCGPGRDCGSVTCFLFLQLKEAQLIFIVETISLIEGHLFNVNKCRTPKINPQKQQIPPVFSKAQ